MKRAGQWMCRKLPCLFGPKFQNRFNISVHLNFPNYYCRKLMSLFHLELVLANTAIIMSESVSLKTNAASEMLCNAFSILCAVIFLFQNVLNLRCQHEPRVKTFFTF